jgi:hypothetical protein
VREQDFRRVYYQEKTGRDCCAGGGAYFKPGLSAQSQLQKAREDG